jgi:hypothetical protein
VTREKGKDESSPGPDSHGPVRRAGHEQRPLEAVQNVSPHDAALLAHCTMPRAPGFAGESRRHVETVLVVVIGVPVLAVRHNVHNAMRVYSCDCVVHGMQDDRTRSFDGCP